MNKEELIGKLQMVYVGDRNALNEMIDYYDRLKQGIEVLQQENKQLKDNWNELKKYIQDICCYDEVGLRIIDPSYLEDKIAELEIGVSNEL